MNVPPDPIGLSREELAALGRTLVTLVCHIAEQLVDATDRCERCNGTAACDACFAALQTILRYHRLARDIEARLAAVHVADVRRGNAATALH